MSEVNTKMIVVIDGMDYPIDIGDLTGKEVRLLKEHGHVLGIAVLGDAIMAGDLEALAALAGIAVLRSGGTPNWDKLQDMPTGKIALKEWGADPLADTASEEMIGCPP